MSESGCLIYVTKAKNDDDLFRALGSRAVRAPLQFGDANFFGYAKPDGSAARILVERKKLGDMAGCILSGHYLYQARSAYEAGYDHLVLILEAREVHRSTLNGLVEVLVARKMMTPSSLTPRLHRGYRPLVPEIQFSRFDQFLTEVQRDMGVIYKRTGGVRETADTIEALWDNFQQPPDKHKSLHQFFDRPHAVELLGKPSFVRRVAKEIDGIGWDRSKAVEQRFRTVREMCDASVEDWLEVEGIGEKTARNAVSQLGGKLS